MTDFEVRPLPLADARALRQEVLRPHQTVEELAHHEPAGAVAFGAFEGSELVAVGLVGPDGEPGDWRVRGIATARRARGRGAGFVVASDEFEPPDIGPHYRTELSV
jgi:hypothetical protein